MVTTNTPNVRPYYDQANYKWCRLALLKAAADMPVHRKAYQRGMVNLRFFYNQDKSKQS